MLTLEELITLDLLITSVNDSLNEALAEDGQSDASDALQAEFSLLRKLRAEQTTLVTVHKILSELCYNHDKEATLLDLANRVEAITLAATGMSCGT